MSAGCDGMSAGCTGLKGTVFLTGANGFLGSEIARCLLRDTDCCIVALVRADDQEAAVRRLSRAWWDWPELAGAIGSRVRVLRGDVSMPSLGIEDPAAYSELVATVTHVVHTAADLRPDGPIEELRKTNVLGTANVLELGRAAHRHHGVGRFSHVSTAYVAGATRSGWVAEDSLTDEFGFASAYERSKFEGELLVRAAANELPVSVFRPGMVVGDSQTGAIKTFNTIYFILRHYLAGRLRILPASPRLRVNIVPVDYVAHAVVHLTFSEEASGRWFHLTAPHESLPTAGQLAAFVRKWAEHRLGVRLPRAFFVPMSPGFAPLVPLVPPTLRPYLSERRRFLRDNVDRLLGPYALDWREFLPHLLEHAVYAGFMHRSDRTVHEQVLFRLRSRSRPVTYHDVIEGKVVTRTAADVRRDMISAAAALRSMGVGRGDRVAVVGLNSTRYLTVDIAIGLVGAVSVPLYYTSPPSDIREILAASGSRLLFVGTPDLLGRIDELRGGPGPGAGPGAHPAAGAGPDPGPELQVVSFERRGPVPSDLPRGVLTWEEFLARGQGEAGRAESPAGARPQGATRGGARRLPPPTRWPRSASATSPRFVTHRVPPGARRG